MTHNVSKSTGDLGVSSALVVNGQAIVTGVQITTASADAVVIIYDSATAANTKIFHHEVTNDDTTIEKTTYIKLPDVKCRIGMFVVVTGTGAVVIVHYR